jgi:hypothetical protein
MPEMPSCHRVLAPLARISAVLLGLGLPPAQLLAQQLQFNLPWSHETGN